MNLFIGTLICGVPLLFVILGARLLERGVAYPHRRSRHLLGFGLLFFATLLLVIALPALDPTLNFFLILFALTPIIVAYVFAGLAYLVRAIRWREGNELLALISIVIVPGTILLGWLGGKAVGENRAEKAVRLGRARGDVIYRALSSFAQDTGAPPASLEELVPTYLTEVPGAPDGNQWVYSAPDGAPHLGFEVPGRCCLHDHDAQQWECQKMNFFDRCAP